MQGDSWRTFDLRFYIILEELGWVNEEKTGFVPKWTRSVLVISKQSVHCPVMVPTYRKQGKLSKQALGMGELQLGKKEMCAIGRTLIDVCPIYVLHHTAAPISLF